MIKRAFLSGVLLVLIILANGCATVYQGAKGVKAGAKEDWAQLSKSVDSSDAWLKDNLW